MKYRYRFGERPLDGYTIRRGVGQGAFGEVYYAVSDGGREVALKSILRNEEVELRGVRQCINLKSPQLVSVFDVRPGNDGTTFVIMEYVSGPSLRDLLREHPRGLGAPETVYLMREIGKGLTYLHEHGIVHRDLKPENIFYEEGRAKIGDYGLAKLLNTSQASGQTMSVGTVHYMAPEIGSGNYQRGVDIYSLGIILHELRTGRVPFEGDSFGEILMKHLTAEPDLSSLTEPFRCVVANALIKDPRERAGSVCDMLRPLLSEETLDVDQSTFHPHTLSSVAREYQSASVAEFPEATLTLATAASGSSERARPEDAAVQPASRGIASRRASHAVVVFLAGFVVIAWDLLKRLGAGAWATAKTTGRAAKFLLTAPFGRRFRTSSSAGRFEVPPARRGVLVRLFWSFIGSAVFAGGVCCVVAPFLLAFRDDEALVLLGVGLGLAVFGRRILVILAR